ncbi:MAG TPA: RsmE family RNA methyltransferase [Chlamydiales bacterium]|nr:RsmE family RNA methyltransferase [Chlamydiales bacterium]
MPHSRFYIPKRFEKKVAVTIEDEEFHHLQRVMRHAVGDEVELINGMGQLAKARVSAIGKRSGEVVVENVRTEEKQTKKIILALAFLKPNHFEIAIEKATELGADAFWLFPGDRSEKKAVSETYMTRLQTIVIGATKQCGRLFLPEISVRNDLKDCLQADLCLYGDVSEDAPKISEYTNKIGDESTTALLIGPESGFSEKEVTEMKRAGAVGITLHHNILRAETAAIVGMLLLS